MKKLSELCLDMSYTLLSGSMDTPVTDIAYDSRRVTKGAAFVCIKGALTDGHRYIADALSRGASVVVIEEEPAVLPEGVTTLLVPSARRALADLSAAHFDYPARSLVTIGVTGTKGKTTVTHMIASMLTAAGEKAGLIGTIGTQIGSETVPAKNTTPESYELQKSLAAMREAGCTYAVMEVSSQGLKLDRTAGILFDYGVFSNFSPDHIGAGEHASLQEYLACKSLLFRQCRVGVINADDPSAEKVLAGHTCTVKSFAAEDEAGHIKKEFMGQPVDLWAQKASYLREEGKLGMRFCTDGCMRAKAQVMIPGRFSVYNSLAAMLVCHLAGMADRDILRGLQQAQVRGRVERVPVPGDIDLIIDYAHNEASTRSVLCTLLAYHPHRLICVYGGGGNRSRLRRVDMGKVTGELADLSVLTCDNPRDEEIGAINADIKEGLAKSGGSYIEIDDRKEAIAYCLRQAQPGDMIVLLGKGHETYQEIKGKKYPYDEREAVAMALAEIAEE